MTSGRSSSPRSTGTSAQVRRRRAALVGIGAALLLLVVVLVLQQCVAQEPERPHPTELGYPSAPEQSEAPAAADLTEDITAVPLAELPDPDWVAETSEAAQIPQRALTAYAGAALRLAETRPECGLGWNTLAGIGQVESVHGHYGGASIGEDGVVDPPVIGVALDGSEGLMAIPDTDDGELDGDTEWDRAVGPMQFIPTTWEQYGHDANQDGQADVHQYDDAALTAGIYLCENGEDLTGDFGWNDAVTAYNQSVEYANNVAGYALEYAESVQEDEDEQ
ncbi:lytic transglycosylase domain-containing protein [Nesterenkonia populi]|uniref:lytic transglycosylase domain-containing protein n=1 Tax=Nesterenkonia populi TaxID=1591087 RepID=UPI001FE51E02|nr:lytic murein transglycosylase [Nesterenkonia populi]